MRITKKQVHFANSMRMNDTVLEEVKEFKDPGILTNSSLSWDSYTDMITAKASRMLGINQKYSQGSQGCNHRKEPVLHPSHV